MVTWSRLAPVRWCRTLGVGLLLLGAAACATPKDPPLPLTGDAKVDAQTVQQEASQRNRVLWDYRVAAAAMRQGAYDSARQLLDDAISRMGGIQADSESAAKARSYFREEGVKVFLGEPYERAMAFYYRGILYWMEGEPDNARACFRSAQLQDSDTEDREYASDYVLLDYLEGLITEKLGGDGSDHLRRARQVAKMTVPPDYQPGHNLILFCEFGQGPTKYATGEYQQELRFRPGHSKVHAARIQFAQQDLHAPAYDNLTYQATTRGGRVMDHILANKAVFKKSTDTAGNVALIGGLVLAQNRRTQEAGLGLAAAGLLSKIIASTTVPRADTRDWDNLPQYLGFASTSLPAGNYSATIEFLNAGGRPIPYLTRSTQVHVAEPNQDTVLFFSERKR
jgi:tetratricopeptide (TPR) repeat protein